MDQSITLRDVTLREYGQNVKAAGLAAFDTKARLWLARALIAAGFHCFEVASTASPRVAPAMDDGQLRPFLEALGRPDQTELITLVPPTKASFRRFLDLGLGSDGLGHTMGVFLSAMDEHNLANLRCTVGESLAQLRVIVPLARRQGVPVVGYVSAAFGFVPRAGAAPVRVPHQRIAELVGELADLDVSSVTLSDLQGVADPAETEAILGEVIAGSRPSPLPIGYHPHHLDPSAALDNVEAAARAGVRLFDASLGAVGGCVTGAPGNAPTEGVAARLESLGFTTGLDPKALVEFARQVDQRIYRPVSIAAS